ncbi:MAG: IS66 family transposase [Myxococcales bacterium]|nr:IS66 family transposase [Myxococcales bacterium]
MRQQVRDLAALLEKATRRIEELEEKLGQNSRNSSKPPSSDSPQERRARRKKRKSGRKRGGQLGHAGTTRKKAPPEDVDDTQKYVAGACGACGVQFDGTESVRVVTEHQVWDILLAPVSVTAHQSCGVECPHCGTETVEAIPPEVPQSSFGPNVTALISYLVGNGRMSRRKVQQLLAEVFKLDISLGAISECERRVADAVEPAVEELRREALLSPIKHMDLTGWTEEGERRQILTVVTEHAVVFWILDDGTRVSLTAAVGEPSGTLVSDRGTVFDHWPLELRQACLAHIKRAFEAMASRTGDSRAVGSELGELLKLLFHVWHTHQEGEGFDADTLQSWHATFLVEFERLLGAGAQSRNKKTAGTCNRLRQQLPMLLTFLLASGVQPTNNDAERALRHFVIWSNLCYGSQSERGSRFAAYLMSVLETLRLRGRSVFSYIRQAILAGLHGEPPPRLLPAT